MVETVGFCPRPGCRNRSKGPCEACRQRTQRHHDERRGTRTQRGYDNRWLTFSKARLARFPWCVGFPEGFHGAARVLAECTDHRIPLRQRPELKYVESNLQSLCFTCNTRKAVALEGGFGRAREATT